jgi:hypothetical protein
MCKWQAMLLFGTRTYPLFTEVQQEPWPWLQTLYVYPYMDLAFSNSYAVKVPLILHYRAVTRFSSSLPKYPAYDFPQSLQVNVGIVPSNMSWPSPSKSLITQFMKCLQVSRLPLFRPSPCYSAATETFFLKLNVEVITDDILKGRKIASFATSLFYCFVVFQSCES